MNAKEGLGSGMAKCLEIDGLLSLEYMDGVESREEWEVFDVAFKSIAFSCMERTFINLEKMQFKRRKA